jgi:serralysin
LIGGTGNDIMTSGAGADEFVFIGKTGKDTIVDFEHGVDTFVAMGYGTVEDVTEAISDGLRQVGSNVVLTVKGIGTVTFLNDQLSNFSESDLLVI